MRSLRLLAPMALVLLAAGCAHHGRYHDDMRSGGWKPNPTMPQVAVIGDQITVDMDPLVFNSQGPKTITWTLAGDESLSFPPNGITVDRALSENSPDVAREFRCNIVPETKNRKFTCFNMNSTKGRHQYKYSIRVLRGTQPLAWDPTIVNQW